MKSFMVFRIFLTFFAFNLLTGTYASLPKWSTLIPGPTPPPPLHVPFTELPPSELSPHIPLLEPTEGPDVFSVASYSPVLINGLTQTPKVLVAVSSVGIYGSLHATATPVASASPISLSDDLPAFDSPQTSVESTPTTPARPVSVLDLLDVIFTPPQLGKQEQQPVETEMPIVTPEATQGSLALPSSPSETNMQTRDIHRKHACFPSNAYVTLLGGTRIPIARLRVGDMVESEPGHFSPVLLHTHADTNANTMFVVLRTRRGHHIAASPGHYLLTTEGRLRLARDFRVNNQLRTASGVDYVVSVERAIYRGLHNPQTASGKLLVALGNEAPAVQASTYTTAVLPNVAHAAMSPLRTLQSALSITFPVLTACVRIVAESPLFGASYEYSVVNQILGRLPRSITADVPFYILLILSARLAAKE